MKNKQAFTLIELLVVVLIIGILAAVALPQFEMAVEKSRAMNAVLAVKALAEANERYYLANGAYPENSGALELADMNADLDIEMPKVNGFRLYRVSSLYIAASRNTSRFKYMISKTLDNSSYNRGLTCSTSVDNDTSRSAKLCMSICRIKKLYKVWGGENSGCEFQ